MIEELDQNALEHGSMMPANKNDEIKALLESAGSSKAFFINAGYEKPKEAYELIEMDALARNIVHYAKNSVMPFEQVVQVTKERLEKAFREFSARPNPKPSNEKLTHGSRAEDARLPENRERG